MPSSSCHPAKHGMRRVCVWIDIIGSTRILHGWLDPVELAGMPVVDRSRLAIFGSSCSCSIWRSSVMERNVDTGCSGCWIISAVGLGLGIVGGGGSLAIARARNPADRRQLDRGSDTGGCSCISETLFVASRQRRYGGTRTLAESRASHSHCNERGREFCRTQCSNLGRMESSATVVAKTQFGLAHDPDDGDLAVSYCQPRHCAPARSIDLVSTNHRSAGSGFAIRTGSACLVFDIIGGQCNFEQLQFKFRICRIALDGLSDCRCITDKPEVSSTSCCSTESSECCDDGSPRRAGFKTRSSGVLDQRRNRPGDLGCDCLDVVTSG